MIKPELYKRTTDILYQAYFNHTLEHQNCYACAVGNLVAANMCKRFVIDEALTEQKLYWEGYNSYDIKSTGGKDVSWFGIIKRVFSHGSGNHHEEIISTGYTIMELTRIEHAFEVCERGKNDEDWMFNGLVAVLEVLKEIHQVTDQDLLTNNNNRFKEQYERRTVKTVL